MKIAITTPTGNIGSKLTDLLLDDGSHELTLLVRNAAKVKAFTDRGAKAVIADLSNAASVTAATAGIDSLFWVNPPSHSAEDFIGYYRQLAENAAAAVKANGIQRVVLVSSIGAHIGHGVGPVNGFKPVETILKEASTNLTILRPTFFMENYLASLQTITEANSVYLPIRGEATCPMIATADIAQAAYEVMKEPFEGTRVMPLHGPKDYSFDEAAEAIGKAIGKEVKHVQITPEQTVEALTGMGIGQNVAELYAELYTSVDSGHMKDEFPRSDKTTTPTTMEQFANNVIVPIVRQ